MTPLRAPVRVARCAAAVGLLVVIAGCGQARGGSAFGDGSVSGGDTGSDVGPGDDSNSPGCPLICSGDQGALFNLSCAPIDLTSVVLSGPCATGDASPSNYVFGNRPYVLIRSPSAGVCHVELIFTTGFTYSTDVTFILQTDQGTPGCPGCRPHVTPTQSTFMVNNPSTTCGDAGEDATGDGGLDAGADG